MTKEGVKNLAKKVLLENIKLSAALDKISAAGVKEIKYSSCQLEADTIENISHCTKAVGTTLKNSNKSLLKLITN